MNTISSLLADVKLPRMLKVIQKFDDSCIDDVAGELWSHLSKPEIAGTIKKGMRIAITCGSRGIDNYPLILKEIVRFAKEKGALPFIVPAMGSHGGATAEGQRQVCNKMGVTEEYCGCPIKSCMEVKKIGFTKKGDEVCIDRLAAEADGIVIVNRIKNHTGFRGQYESGLMKMLTIGLGKQHGAHICHRRGYGHMADMVPMIANVILKSTNILFGVGLLENAYDKTTKIAVLKKSEIATEEPRLLIEAKSMMPSILCGTADVLIVDWMGKNFSGGGMDSNITGRVHNPWAGEPRFRASKLAVLDLSPESGGNMHGVGAADVINRRIFQKASLEITYPNCITSTTLLVNKIPVMMKNDCETIKCAIKTCNAEDPSKVKVVRIKNTLEISEILVSDSMIDILKSIPNIVVTNEYSDWIFNDEGNLW